MAKTHLAPLLILVFMSGTAWGLCFNLIWGRTRQRAALEAWKDKQTDLSWIDKLDKCPDAVELCGVSNFVIQLLTYSMCHLCFAREL